MHQFPAVPPGHPRTESSSPARLAEGARGLSPSDARSRAYPRSGYVLAYVTCAVFIARMLPTAEASLAAILALSRFGMATAATISTGATLAVPELLAW